MSLQNAIEHIDEANIRMIEAERFRLIEAPLLREVRSALNAAVREGRLGHLKKDELMPETYYHPGFKYMAVHARKEVARRAITAIGKVSAQNHGDGSFSERMGDPIIEIVSGPE